MKVTAEKLSNIKAEATVEISPEEFEASMDKAYRIVVKKVNVPGFRKGKAPRKILEKMYGREILLDDALQDAVPKAFAQALDELKDEYTCVSEPEYEVLEVEEDKPVKFKAIFEIKPEITLGQYKGLELERIITEVTTEDVDAEIEKMRERYAKLVVVDGPAENGDIVGIDYVGTVDGEAFEGGTAQNYMLELGSNTFIPGFEDQLIGAAKDQTVEVKVQFPTEYHAEELAGKDAIFTVTVKEIKRKEYSPLDDEFAKDVSEFETLQELRSDVENKLREANKQREENELREAAIKKAAENTEVELPESMVVNRTNRMINEMAFRIEQQGIPFDYYLQITNTDINSLQENYRQSAEESVKADLVLEAIVKAEGIKAEAEDIDKEIAKMAEIYNQEADKLRETLEKQDQISTLEFGIMMEKAVDLIIKEAKITDKIVEKTENVEESPAE
ncbi:MAG: trigger factor [Peptococcia bacterium]